MTLIDVIIIGGVIATLIAFFLGKYKKFSR
jgi:hypothetical protein